MGDLIHERHYTFTNGSGEKFHVLLQMDEAKLERAARNIANRALACGTMKASCAYQALNVTVTKVLR